MIDIALLYLAEGILASYLMGVLFYVCVLCDYCILFKLLN